MAVAVEIGVGGRDEVLRVEYHELILLRCVEKSSRSISVSY